MKVVLTAGGTGGHIYPAVAMIEKLKKEKDDFIFIGTTDRMESTIIPSMGHTYYGLEIRGLSKNIKNNINNMSLVRASYKKAIKILKEYKPDVVIGFGGYVTFPVLLAAKKLKIKTMIHEQNSLPGKTNKLLSLISDKVFISFKSSSKYFNSKKVVYSKNPTGTRAYLTKKTDKTKLGFDKKKKLIIIVMGSLGSSTVNKVIYDMLQTFKEPDKEVLFITGKTFYKQIDKRKIPKSVKVVEFYNNLPSIMKDADLIISRAGASTMSEISSVCIPSILIPSPYVANNHQFYNAQEFYKKNMCFLLEEKSLNKTNLKNMINNVLDNEKEYKKVVEALKKNAKNDASDIIYKEMIKEVKDGK